jgi:hypothetical protein
MMPPLLIDLVKRPTAGPRAFQQRPVQATTGSTRQETRAGREAQAQEQQQEQAQAQAQAQAQTTTWTRRRQAMIPIEVREQR